MGLPPRVKFSYTGFHDEPSTDDSKFHNPCAVLELCIHLNPSILTASKNSKVTVSAPVLVPFAKKDTCSVRLPLTHWLGGELAMEMF